MKTKQKKTKQQCTFIYLTCGFFFLKIKPLKSLDFLRYLKSVLIQAKGKKRLLWSFL